MTQITDISILRALGDFVGNAPSIPTTLLVFNAGNVSAYNDQPLVVGDLLIEFARHNFSSTAFVVSSNVADNAYTAEQWLEKVGYSPLRLLTCLDLESKLIASNLTSPKLSSVRQWLDQITILAAVNPDQPRTDWALPPFSFAECSGEALQLIQGA
jgi:hypothetical protein